MAVWEIMEKIVATVQGIGLGVGVFGAMGVGGAADLGQPMLKPTIVCLSGLAVAFICLGLQKFLGYNEWGVDPRENDRGY